MPIGAIAPRQTDLLTIGIDPSWPLLQQWTRDVGRGVNRVAARFMDLEDGITEEASTNYAEAEVFGRAETIRTFTGLGARNIPLVFKYFVQGDVTNGLNTAVANLFGVDTTAAAAAGAFATFAGRQSLAAASSLQSAIIQEVYVPAKLLDAFRYPYTPTSGIQHAPPPLILRMGVHLVMRGVITDLKLAWQSPIDPETHLFFGCNVELTFTAVTKSLSNYRVSPIPYRVGAVSDTVTDSITPNAVTISTVSPGVFTQ